MNEEPTNEAYEEGTKSPEGPALETSRIEKALRESEDLYRVLIETSPDPIILYDLKGKLLAANMQCARTYGVESVGEFLQEVETIFDLLQEEFKPAAAANFLHTLSRGVSERNEYPVRLRDGRMIDVEINSATVRTETGEPRAFISVVRDISNRKRMEESLRQAKQHLDAHIENSPVAIVEFDPAFHVIRWSGEAERVFGWKSEEIVGKAMGDIRWVHEEDVDKIREVSEAMLSGNRPKNLIVNRNYRKDGSIVQCEWYNSAIYDARGRMSSVLSIVLDISDREHAEAEQLKLRKLESLGILAGGIAHDFKNLLAIIQGNMELIKMEIPPGSKAHARILAAEKSVSQATELTDRVITFARGGEPVKKVINDIAEMITDIVLRSAGSSPVEKKFHLDHDLWPAEIDGGQIRQVVANLTVNAIEAMPDGGMLMITAENKTVNPENRLPLSDGPYIRISVEDTGTGIPADQLPLIFDPYFSTKQRGTEKGMGLGLSVCHSVVSKHNGCITVESKAGKGSVFHVYLPAAVIISGKAAIDKRPADKGPESKGRILILDDEAMVRDMLRELLEALGYEADATGDGLAAVDLYIKAGMSRHPYNMVLLDLTVPGGLGGKLTMERLRAIDPAVKGIILSGYADDPVMQNFSQYGFLGSLMKPFALKELRDILEKYM